MIKRFLTRPCVLLILPLLFLLPGLDGFIYNRGADFNDLAISHYPNAIWMQRSVVEWGEIPLWSDTILSGYPFAANPLSGLHYPPGWLALLLPLPFGLNLTAVLHLLWGGVGMYRFARSQGCGQWAALLGGLAYEAMPKLMAHLGAGHLTLIYAASWLPWLLLAQEAAWKRPRRDFILPGFVLGLILLADVRMVIVAGAVWAAFSLDGIIRRRSASLRRDTMPAIGRMMCTPIIALGLGAALLLPLNEYVQASTRSLMQLKDIGALSLPAVRLLGLIVPEMGGTAEWVVFPGSMVLALGLLSLSLPAVNKRIFLWWGIFILSILWSLGDQLPWFPFLAGLPVIDMLRVPPRMMIGGLFSLILASSLTANILFSDAGSLSRLPKVNALLILVGLAFFLIAITTIVWVSSGEFPLRFVWGAVSLIGTLTLIFLARGQRIPAQVVPWLVCGWLLLDLSGVNLLSLDFRSKTEILGMGSQMVYALINEGTPDYFRVYSPSHSIPQQTATAGHIELADGVDPLQLKRYAEFMQAATGIQASGYSVTMPPFAHGDPATDNQAAVPEARLLGWLNIRYVVAAFPIQADGLDLVNTYDGAYLYFNRYTLPRAWVQTGEAVAVDDIRSVPIMMNTANSLTLAAEGPGLLVVSEVAYPGWQAWVDGLEEPVSTVSGLLRGVELPSGHHIVRLEYRPSLFFIGCGISLTTLLLLGLWKVVNRSEGR